MSFLSIKNMSAGYGNREIIKNISFTCNESSVTCILGANGSGKTTLLKSICGILPHSGSCLLKDMPLEKLSVKQRALLCGYIPQRSGINIDISAVDVVLMGFNPQLGLLERPSASMYTKAVRALELVGLAEEEQHNYLTLSEGQKQLCILARTLVMESRLLLLDEPESSLDFKYRYKMLEILKNRVTKKGKSALITLHDPNLALQYCNKLILLKSGKILGSLEPATDSHAKMEKALSDIYGKVTLSKCTDSSGAKHLIMLKNHENKESLSI